MERRLLVVAVVLLLAQFVTSIVPGPFSRCHRETGEWRGSQLGFDSTTTCEPTWWPLE